MRIHIIGPYNSGTNLLVKMLKDNVRGQDGQTVEIEENYHDNGKWGKHCISKDTWTREIVSNKQDVFICLYKPLYNWIASMQTYSYNIRSLDGKRLAYDANGNWIDRPCKGVGDVVKGDITRLDPAGKIIPIKFDNLIDVHNQYYRMYRDIIQQHYNVIPMNYYDFIIKNVAYEHLNNALCAFRMAVVSKSQLVKVLDSPAKKHPMDNGTWVSSSKEALAKRTRCYERIKSIVDRKQRLRGYHDHTIAAFFDLFSWKHGGPLFLRSGVRVDSRR